VSNHNRCKPVWLFDLDNTLHNATPAIFPAITAKMNDFLARVLGEGGLPADAELVSRTRLMYWQRYGNTLAGMVKHHDIKAADFLRETHDIGDLAELVHGERGLTRLLRQLPGRKILFTNAPERYSRDVVRELGLRRHFSDHIAVENMRVHRQLRPKPSKLMLRRLLRKHGLAAHRCILVEDTLANLRSAKAMGLGTAWVTGWLAPAHRRLAGVADVAVAQHAVRAGLPFIRPAYVDVKVKSVRQLRASLHRLR
jgi:putative hydrolase of the HAD superfamily